MKDMNGGAEASTQSAGSALWVYGYQMNPPLHEERMTGIRDLLEEENNRAAQQGRKWTGCLVSDERVTHVLVVTSSPAVNLDINRRIETELRALGVRFETSVPMPV